MTKHERHIAKAEEAAKKTPQQLEEERRKLRARRAWVERKIAHWTRMGTPAEISPHTGAAVPKWKLEDDKATAKSLLKTCDRQCRKQHNKRASL